MAGVVAKFAIACQSPNFRCHLNEATKLATRPCMRPPVDPCIVPQARIDRSVDKRRALRPLPQAAFKLASFFREPRLAQALVAGRKVVGTCSRNHFMVKAWIDAKGFGDERLRLGISAWNLKLSERTKQQDLVITPCTKPRLPVTTLRSLSSSISCSIMRSYATSSTRLVERACCYWGGSLKIGSLSSNGCGMNCAGAATCQSCSTSTNRRQRTSRKPCGCSRGCPSS